ncbi:sensor histidine kinase [Deinococcus yavapaiensis]|uniref:histidine kinase n=1 Tax=Deinococcus yavapaiensis KR-236 TaxID=694435 RepID=A0A318SMN5_9DEIO|nr:PAS domain-containing protein [Deinococcus yavapaiensis]PYE53801.1 PAS domain S-box-containing protein [Deinococcus yavapaiensis KR-236]
MTPDPVLARRLLEETFEHAPMGLAVFDTHLRYVHINAALAALNGLPREAHLNRTIEEVLPHLPRTSTLSLRRVLETGVASINEVMSGFVPASSERRTWSTTQYPLRDETDRIVGVARVVVDVTEQKRAEEMQREQAELLALANETVIVRTPDSVITAWNGEAEKMYGYTAAQALGRNSHALLRTVFPISPDAVMAALLNEGFWQGELRHERDDGEVVHVLSRQALQRDAEGTPRAILEVNWDITSRVRAEQALQQANVTLERRVEERTAELSVLNEQLEAFSYTVAHDLRTPLRSMQGFAEAVREDYGAALDEDGRDMLRRIAQSAARMDALIHDLLEYSRLSRVELPLEPTALTALFDVVLEHLHELLASKHARVQVANDLPVVLAQPKTLLLVVTNLLTNAVKFVPPSRTPAVDVWSELHGEYARILVRDNGVGVEARHQERIWRVFERLHTTEEYPGTGVGLAIVKKGVERMYGRVGVTATPGEGSCFWFELPVVRTSP